jgi:NADPH:quinone reductase-like Zn-dependent oxidoreductase
MIRCRALDGNVSWGRKTKSRFAWVPLALVGVPVLPWERERRGYGDTPAGSRARVVTGANSGIGRAAVVMFCGRGALVTATDRSDDVTTVWANDGGVVSVVGDITANFCAALADQAERRAPVTALFHSAGIMPGVTSPTSPRRTSFV